MKISEMITDKYKLRIPPTVYYDLLADVQEVEEDQESTTKNDHHRQNIQAYAHDFGVSEEQAEKELRVTTKNDLGVDREQLKNMIRGLTKWYVKRDNAEVGQPNTAVGLLYDDVMFGIDRLSSVTPQEPKTGHWIVAKGSYLGMRNACCSNCKDFYTNDWNAMNYCPNCGADMREVEE